MKIRTAKGAVIDMASLAARNSTTIALGNAGMNARGDLIDRKGRILKTRDVVIQEYYDKNPKAVTQTVSLRDIGEEVLTPKEAMAKLDEAVTKKKSEIKVESKRRKIVEKDD